MSPQHRAAKPIPACRRLPRFGLVDPGCHRFDPDRIVGFICVALLPFVLWLARY